MMVRITTTETGVMPERRHGKRRGDAGPLDRCDRVGDIALFSREWLGPDPANSPVVVMVHGLSVSSRYMIPTADLLSTRYRVLAPDLPGFGRSGRPAKVLGIPELAEVVAMWMEKVATGPAILLGNSMGCQVVAELALRRPEMAAGLVLVSPTIDPARRNSIQQIGRWLLNIPREPFSLMPAVFLDYLVAGPRRTLLSYLKMMRHRMEAVLPGVEAPALVVRGGRDPIVPLDWAARATGLMPRGALVEVLGAAHAVNFNSAAALAAAIDDFVQRLSLGDRIRRPAA